MLFQFLKLYKSGQKITVGRWEVSMTLKWWLYCCIETSKDGFQKIDPSIMDGYQVIEWLCSAFVLYLISLFYLLPSLLYSQGLPDVELQPSASGSLLTQVPPTGPSLAKAPKLSTATQIHQFAILYLHSSFHDKLNFLQPGTSQHTQTDTSPQPANGQMATNQELCSWTQALSSPFSHTDTHLYGSTLLIDCMFLP